MKIILTALVLVSIGMFDLNAHADDAQTTNQTIRDAFVEMVPDQQRLKIEASDTANVYLVSYDGQFTHLYSDDKTLLIGELIDVNTKQSFTDLAKKSWTKSQIEQLGQGSPVSFGSPKNKRAVYVFTDVDCGYCRKFHESELAALNEAGVTVSYLAYPRAGLGTKNHDRLNAVWCADNPQEAMTSSKKGSELSSPQCDTPVVEHFEFANKIGVSGTPSILLDDGTYLRGYRTSEQLLEMLN